MGHFYEMTNFHLSNLIFESDLLDANVCINLKPQAYSSHLPNILQPFKRF